MQICTMSSKLYFERNIKGRVKGDKVFENGYHNICAFFE